MSDRFKTLLVAVLVALTITGWSYVQRAQELPPEEISAARFDRLLTFGRIASADVSPNPYRSIYTITGEFHRYGNSPKSPFTLTAQPSESRSHELLSLSNSRLQLPHSGTNAKFWDILPTALISLIIVGLLVYQHR